MEPSTIRNLQNVAGCWWVANYPGQGGHWRGAQCPVVPRLMVVVVTRGAVVVTRGDPGTQLHWGQENVPFKSGSAVPTPLDTRHWSVTRTGVSCEEMI